MTHSVILGPDGAPLLKNNSPMSSVPDRKAKPTARRAASRHFFVRPDRSADHDWNPERGNVVAAAKDLVRNNELVAGNVTQHVDLVVGRRFRLSPNPSSERLGWTRAQRRFFVKQVQELWKIDSQSRNYWMDMAGEKSFSQIVANHVRAFRIFGEAFTVVFNRLSPERRPFGMALANIDPSRVATPKSLERVDGWKAGIKRSATRQPLTYAFLDEHPGDGMCRSNTEAHTKVNRFNELTGREQVVHSYCEDLPGLTRGVPIYASAIKRLGCLSEFQDNVLDAASWQATVAATLESEFPDDGVVQFLDEDNRPQQKEKTDYHFDQAQDWVERNEIEEVGKAQIAQLYDRQKLKLQNPGQPIAEYAPYEKSLLKYLSAATNTPLEMLTNDWSGGNFSQTRAGIMVQSRRLDVERSNVAERVACAAYSAWMEDNLANGRLVLPGFEGRPEDAWFFFITEARDELSGSDWFGPARMEIDRAKEAQFYLNLKKAGFDPRTKMANELLDCTGEEAVDQGIELALYEAERRAEVEADNPDLKFSWQSTEEETTTETTEAAE